MAQSSKHRATAKPRRQPTKAAKTRTKTTKAAKTARAVRAVSGPTRVKISDRRPPKLDPQPLRINPWLLLPFFFITLAIGLTAGWRLEVHRSDQIQARAHAQAVVVAANREAELLDKTVSAAFTGSSDFDSSRQAWYLHAQTVLATFTGVQDAQLTQLIRLWQTQDDNYLAYLVADSQADVDVRTATLDTIKQAANDMGKLLAKNRTDGLTAQQLTAGLQRQATSVETLIDQRTKGDKQGGLQELKAYNQQLFAILADTN